MGLYEQIRDIAKSKGYSINSLEQELGFARSSINKFNKNVPSTDKVQKIADYLDVSVDYLLSGSDAKKNEITITAKDERDIAKDLKKMMDDIKNDKDGPFYFDGAPTDEMSREFLANAIESAMKQMKIINKEKYNPHKNKK